MFLELRGFAARLILHVDLEGEDALLLAMRMPEVLGRPKQEAGVGESAGENLHKGRPRPQKIGVHQACSMHSHLCADGVLTVSDIFSLEYLTLCALRMQPRSGCDDRCDMDTHESDISQQGRFTHAFAKMVEVKAHVFCTCCHCYDCNVCAAARLVMRTHACHCKSNATKLCQNSRQLMNFTGLNSSR